MTMVDITSALEKAKAIAAKLTAKTNAEKRGPDEDGDRDSKRLRPGLGSSSYATGPNSGMLFHQEEIIVPTSKVGLIIGRGGEMLKQIELDTGTRISVPRDQTTFDTRIVVIEGEDRQREAAKEEIELIISGRKDSIIVPPGHKKVDYVVPRSKIGLVIGKGGDVIKNIQHRSGAKVEASRNPDSTGETNTIFIVGTDPMIESAKKLIEEIINPQGSGPHDIMFVPSEKVGLVIGKGGETIKLIQTECNVKVTIETQSTPQGRAISIQGMPDCVEMAKQMISEKVYGYATAYQTYEGSGPIDPFAPGHAGYNDAYSSYSADPYAAYAYYYQQQYPQAGGDASASTSGGESKASAADGQAVASTMPTDPNDPNYAAYYAAMANDPNYAAWYNYYYGGGAYAAQDPSASQPTESQESTTVESTDQKHSSTDQPEKSEETSSSSNSK